MSQNGYGYRILYACEETCKHKRAAGVGLGGGSDAHLEETHQYHRAPWLKSFVLCQEGRRKPRAAAKAAAQVCQTAKDPPPVFYRRRGQSACRTCLKTCSCARMRAHLFFSTRVANDAWQPRGSGGHEGPRIPLHPHLLWAEAGGSKKRGALSQKGFREQGCLEGSSRARRDREGPALSRGAAA